jgi:hypothetical protein
MNGAIISLPKENIAAAKINGGARNTSWRYVEFWNHGLQCIYLTAANSLP